MKLLVPLVVIALLVVIGFGLMKSKDTMSEPTPIATPAPMATSELDGTSWIAQELSGKEVSDADITIQFDQGRMSGSDGCNRFTSSYTATDGALTVAPGMGGTMMACPEPVMELASNFTSSLAQVTAYVIADDMLTLKNAEGSTVMTLTLDQQTLTDSSWQVTGYNNGAEALVSLMTDTTISLQFSATGTVSGRAGCNTFTGTYTSSDGTVTITGLASTQIMCIKPEGIMDQEAQFVAALQKATVYSIENGALVMRDESGAMQVTAQRE